MNKKLWKITNTSNRQIKIAVAISSHAAPGVILQPEQFCLSTQQMTAPIDAQIKRGFIEVFKEFDNSVMKLKLATAYNESVLNKSETPERPPDTPKKEIVLEKIVEEL